MLLFAFFNIIIWPVLNDIVWPIVSIFAAQGRVCVEGTYRNGLSRPSALVYTSIVIGSKTCTICYSLLSLFELSMAMALLWPIDPSFLALVVRLVTIHRLAFFRRRVVHGGICLVAWCEYSQERGCNRAFPNGPLSFWTGFIFTLTRMYDGHYHETKMSCLRLVHPHHSTERKRASRASIILTSPVQLLR